jgi:integrating conjugative element protein (TIGR03755 family)
MKRTTQRLAASVMIVVLANPLSGAQAYTPGPLGDGKLYYRIGGAQALGLPANRFASTTTIPLSLQLGVNYRCGQFDVLAGLGSALDRIVGLLGHIDDIISAGLAVLPMYILQRVNPGLYDLLQNSLLRAEELVAVSTKTCEQMEGEMARGKDPYEDWIVLSRGRDWKTVIGSGGIDVVKAKEEIDRNLGRNGLTWLCGQARGGQGQAPIQVVYDITRAGWNTLMNREVCAQGTATVTGDDKPRLAEVWATPEAAAEWTVNVIGDTVVRTTSDSPDESRAGVGLLNYHDKEATAIAEKLQALVSGATPLTLEHLEAVTSPGTLISRQVIESIQARAPAEQTLFVTKLAGQVALERTVERALLARRMLLTGVREPHVSATPAPKQLRSFLADLEREIDNLLFESRIKKEISARTAELLLRDESVKRADSRGLVPAADPKKLNEGSVTP